MCKTTNNYILFIYCQNNKFKIFCFIPDYYCYWMIAVIFTFCLYVLSCVIFLVLQETIAIIYFCGGRGGWNFLNWWGEWTEKIHQLFLFQSFTKRGHWLRYLEIDDWRYLSHEARLYGESILFCHGGASTCQSV